LRKEEEISGHFNTIFYKLSSTRNQTSGDVWVGEGLAKAKRRPAACLDERNKRKASQRRKKEREKGLFSFKRRHDEEHGGDEGKRDCGKGGRKPFSARD